MRTVFVLAFASSVVCAGGCFDTTTSSTTIEVVDGDGSPVMGIPVIFHDVNGGLIDSVQTDAGGKVVRHVSNGDMVTVAFDYGGFYGFETVMGLSGSDHLRFLRSLGPTAVTLEVQFSPLAGATGYGVKSGCITRATSSTAGILSVEIPALCAASSVGLFAYGTAGIAQPLAYEVESITPSGTVSVSGDAWRTDWEDVPITATGVASDATIVYLYLGTYVDERWTLLPAWRSSDVPSGGSASATTRRVSGAGVAHYAAAAEIFDSGYASISRRDTDPQPSSVALDLANVLPRVRNVLVDWTDSTRPSVSWDTDAPPDADMLELFADWDFGYWWVRAPPDLPSPALAPELPPEYSGWVPPLGSVVTIEYEDSDYVDGYHEDINWNWLDDAPPNEWVFRRSTGYFY